MCSLCDADPEFMHMIYEETDQLASVIRLLADRFNDDAMATKRKATNRLVSIEIALIMMQPVDLVYVTKQ